MALKSVRSVPAETLKRHISAHRQVAEELRRQIGDPFDAMGRQLRDAIQPEAFEETYKEYRAGGSSWLDEDDGRELNGR
jgi:hypothetical protein